LETWAQAFQNAGHLITRDLSDAHVVIINSCAVTADAARKSRQLIRRIHRDNPSAKLVISGCYVTLNEDEAAQMLGVDLVVSNKDKNQLVEHTLSLLNFDSMPAMATAPGETSLFSLGRQRAFIKVQDGCRYRCTFCIVTVARGEEVSRPARAIIDEINNLHQQGINEAILTGVHLGGYGGDINSNLSQLIQAILDQTSIPRLRLGSLEPWELPDDFFDLFKNPRLMPHLHLPLQSGSDSVLRRMARRCKTEEFASIVNQARQQIKNVNITTDIIVGFPGETEQEWKASFNFIKTIGFGHIHIFTYSSREGTKAAVLPDQLTNEIKKRRSKQLHELAETMKQQFIQDNIHQQYAVLWEAHKLEIENNHQMVFGYTPNYLRVACKISKDENIENKIINAELKLFSVNYIYATLK
jgi:threonylcarbamoyladenosine tRNA methylthiotransferase MtaB